MTADFQHEIQQALGGSYALERELGRGGMGSVYLARDLALDRPVAIKVLPPELAVRPELRERFLRETRTAASFSHPNIVPVHAVEERGAVLCFVMGYVDGETLAQRIRRVGPLPAAEIVRMLQEVAWALSYAHGRGVVHRDIKPDNILIERATGRAMVTDFGIARSTTSTAAGLTRVGEVVGTPHFMSPEQASGDAIDGRSDLYSLGVVAFCAATGHVPFDATSTPAILAMHLTRPAPSAAGERSDLPAPLAAAIDRLLAKDPADRFATGEALVEAIDVARSSRPEVSPAVRLFHAKASQILRNVIMLLLVSPYLTSRPKYDGDQFLLRAIIFSAVVALLLQVAAGLRELARQGFRYDDLRNGLRAIGAEQDDARARSRAAPDWSRRRRKRWAFSAAGLALSVATMVYAASLRVRISPTMFRSPPLALWLSVFGVALFILVLVFTVASAGGGARIDRALQLLWIGPAGRWLFEVMARGISRGAAPAGSTTLSGGRSPLSVLAGLPKPLRRGLGSAEMAIRRLEAEASALAQREAELDGALAEATNTGGGAGDSAASERRSLVNELSEARRAAGTRREAIAAALERVRLQLLRLKSGLGNSADVSRELDAA